MSGESVEARRSQMVSRLRGIHRAKLRASQGLAREAAADRHGADSVRIGKSGRHTRDVPIQALANAVHHEGTGVLKDKGYWDDMQRRHPEIAVERNVCVPTGLFNRHGRVKERITYRDGQKFVETADGIQAYPVRA